MRPSPSASLGAGLAARMAAAALCALLLAGTAAAREERAVQRTISEAFKAGKLNGLHAALVIFQGETLAEVYFDGKDEKWSEGLGVVSHGPDTLHDIRSITKSVVGLLYGIALADRKVPGPDAPLLAQLPEYADLAGDPLRDSITVGDALAMKLGVIWKDDDVGTIAMDHAKDRYRYILDQPMVAAPGEEWSYNGGATALIGKLIEDGAGMALDDYARDKLFKPLGITRWEWRHGEDGEPSAAWGLRLTARDLGKIGRLVLDGGMFVGRRVVPRDWLDEMFTPRTSLSGVRYGYFWWLADSNDPRGWVSGLGNRLADTGNPPAWVAGIGYGGQRLSVQADIGLIVVVLSGNYGDPQDWRCGSSKSMLPPSSAGGWASELLPGRDRPRPPCPARREWCRARASHRCFSQRAPARAAATGASQMSAVPGRRLQSGRPASRRLTRIFSSVSGLRIGRELRSRSIVAPGATSRNFANVARASGNCPV